MKFKRGDTFDYSGSVSMTDAAGAAIDLAGWTVASKIEFPDACTKVELNAEWVGSDNDAIRIHKSETRDWPVGVADMDIQFTSAANAVVSTETVRLEIVEDIT